MRDKNERALAEDYVSRARALGRSLGISDITVTELDSRPSKDGRTSDREAEALLAAIPDGAYVIALDETGRQRSSREFAAWMDTLKDGARRDVVFAIGGADGHGAALRQRADATLSLGAMTWPHMLARILLLEQLYRAISILARHPYHRD